jgi:phospholipid transport system substrate-binding protein
MPLPRRTLTLHGPAALLLGCGIAGTVAPRPAQAVDLGRAAAFIQATGQELVAAINDPWLDLATRRQRVAATLRRAVDIEGAGRFVLGRHWRQATPAEQQEYMRLFEELIIRNLSARFGEYRGVRFTLGRSEPWAGMDALVETLIERPGAAPFTLEWQVGEIDGQPKIMDMIAEGVSLRVTTRDEYSDLIQQEGGSIAALLAAMCNKIQQLAAREER